ncbi:SSI family serine proteinase inhibitor [Blastococcus sp. VKM Ac-2987]|uniref:SSI family serine proteinase inhibitor n=1 Tax=Blastococcus sp. VKM Ac-2987 TaxID=3004141 RepID=UPI0022AB8259|nr:SSI family serine proteinase inhibitor [Blastococcus sp. VKM Ac-2987]MCZ2861194.1 SSI family serine proteinase inhibitor [Blastococcus sp. VKM Ac-2987]
MRRLLLLTLLSTVFVLAGCATGAGDDAAGAAGGGTPGDGGAADGISQADDDLRIEVDRGDGSPPETWTLSCVGPVEGTHPEAEAACAHLRGMSAPFAPVPADAMCTEQYGGAQTARITGRWGGEPVDLELSRVDGCRIAQWDALGPVLPVPVGVEPLG